MRDESGDDKTVSVTLIYDSEVAKGLVTEPWAPQSHLKLVALLRDLYVEACDSRVVSWVHVRSHGRETDPAKQHLLPLNERADRLAERVSFWGTLFCFAEMGLHHRGRRTRTFS